MQPTISTPWLEEIFQILHAITPIFHELVGAHWTLEWQYFQTISQYHIWYWLYNPLPIANPKNTPEINSNRNCFLPDYGMIYRGVLGKGALKGRVDLLQHSWFGYLRKCSTPNWKVQTSELVVYKSCRLLTNCILVATVTYDRNP